MARIRIDDLPVAESLTPEQEALLLGAGLKSFRPTLEGLEDRQLMAAGISFAAATGVLTIQGDASANTASVRQVLGQVRVSLVGSENQLFDKGLVQKIEFRGEDGNDTFTNNTAI